MADDTNFGACSPDIECFVQVLAIHQQSHPSIGTLNIDFSGNKATEYGSNLFGGLLDRCIPSSFAEVYLKNPNLKQLYYNGVSYLQDLSNISFDSIASSSVRVCFCTNESEPDCSYRPPPIRVKKGETFKIPLVAVDQINHSVATSIISSVTSFDGSFSDSEGQRNQSVARNCTKLAFNVFSPSEYESINLFAHGPCGHSKFSSQSLDVEFLNCTCPVGFQPSDRERTRCYCVCSSKLYPYITVTTKQGQ